MTYKAECDVRYRYACERCGYVTDYFEYKLEQLAQHRHKVGKLMEVNIDLDVKAMEATREQALDRLQELIAALTSIYRETSCEIVLPDEPVLVDYYNKVFAGGKACPKCKSSQTWYPVSLSRISKWRSALGFSFAALLLGFGLKWVLDLTGGLFIIMQAIFTLCGALVGYLTANIRITTRKWRYDRVRVLRGPSVEWGEPSVELMGVPAADEDTEDDENNPPAYAERIVNTVESGTEAFGCNHMYGIEHPNLLTIQKVVDYQHGVYGVTEEQFEGVPLSSLIEFGLSFHDFHDYITQLCDALEHMHSQDPPLTHNAVTAENILIGKDNQLKLIRFDHVTVGGSPKDDIAMLGELIAGINKPYIKRFGKVMENCKGTYQEIDELRKDLLPLLRPPYVKILLIVFVVIFTIIRLRRFL